MDAFKDLFGDLTGFGQSAGVLVGLGLLTYLVHRRLLAVYYQKPGQQRYRQLIMACVYLFAVLLAIMLLPLNDQTQAHLLSFLAILISATIALSSTALVANVMAGFLLRSLRNYGPGDYISVGDHFGRVTNMDLLHVDIQTEDADLKILPYMYLITNPVRVMRSSGAIVDSNVLLAYEIPRQKVEAVLLRAADATGLEKAFVQICELGNNSVSYRVSGTLADIDQLVKTRRKLRASILDELHAAGLAQFSSNNVNTRNSVADGRTVPGDMVLAVTEAGDDHSDPDAAVLDKARQAEDLRKLKNDYTACSQELIAVELELKEAGPGEERQPLNLKKKKLEAQLLRANKEIRKLEMALKAGQA